MPLSFPSSRPLYCSILPPTQPPKKGSPLDPAHSPPDLRGEKKVQVGKEKVGPRSSLFSPLAASGAAKGGSRGKRPPSAPSKPATATVGRSYLLREKTKESRWFLDLLKRKKNGGNRTRKNRLRRTNWVAWTIGGINGRGERHKQPRALASYCPVKDSPRIVWKKGFLNKGNCPQR